MTKNTKKLISRQAIAKVDPYESEAAWDRNEEEKAEGRQETFEKEIEERRANGDFDWSWKDLVQLGADIASFGDDLDPTGVYAGKLAGFKTALKSADMTNDIMEGGTKEIAIESLIDRLPQWADVPVSLIYYPYKYGNILYEKTYKRPMMPEDLVMPKLAPFKQYPDNTSVSKPQLLPKMKRK